LRFRSWLSGAGTTGSILIKGIVADRRGLYVSHGISTVGFRRSETAELSLPGSGAEVDLEEIKVAPGSPLVGRTIKSAKDGTERLKIVAVKKERRGNFANPGYIDADRRGRLSGGYRGEQRHHEAQHYNLRSIRTRKSASTNSSAQPCALAGRVPFRDRARFRDKEISCDNHADQAAVIDNRQSADLALVRDRYRVFKAVR
jgi:hypothetical protein